MTSGHVTVVGHVLEKKNPLGRCTHIKALFHTSYSVMPRLILISFKWLTLLVCCSIKTLTLHPLVDCGGLSETCTAANCCGVHIHVGTDCSDASTIGGDFGFLTCGQLYNASYTCWNHSSYWTYNDVQKRNCLPFHWFMVECESMPKPSKIHLPKKQRTSAFWGLKVSAPLALLFCPNLICKNPSISQSSFINEHTDQTLDTSFQVIIGIAVTMPLIHGSLWCISMMTQAETGYRLLFQARRRNSKPWNVCERWI